MAIIDGSQVADSDGDFEHRFDIDGDASTLEAGDQQYDLTDTDEASQALTDIKQKRQALRAGELDEYEDTGTDMWVGGRTRLLYDEVRAQLAVDLHEGEHDMTWEEQSEAADDIRLKVARIRKAQA